MHSRLAGSLLLAALAAPALASPQTGSGVKGVILAPLADLPSAPRKVKLDDFCEGYRAKLTTPAARLVAARGWIVTSEALLGPYQAVSFAGSFEPGTSGVCFAHDSNIAIFLGSRLVALAYGAKAADGTLGTVAPIEPEGLLIESGEGPGVPVGELHADAGGFRVTPLAAAQSVCSGRATVPNVYGLDIKVARKRLIAAGWKPQRPSEAPGEFDHAADFAKEGVVEAETCSGTGYGFCAFNYANGVAALAVTSIGEDYTVSAYAAHCR